MIYIGTSGWIYKDWHDAFYPPGTPNSKLLDYYSSQFPTVEINATFYRLATENAVYNWRERAPPGFIYAVKGSRFITHMLRLNAAARALRRFFKPILSLGKTLGPVLWQLPPTLPRDVKLLRAFTARLPETVRHAFEFRDPSWMEEDVFDALRERNIGLVWISSMKMPQCVEQTADFVYLRFHGLAQGARHDYKKEELATWAKALVKAAEKGSDAYVYFNNDVSARAPENAKLLRKMVGKHAALPWKGASQRD